MGRGAPTGGAGDLQVRVDPGRPTLTPTDPTSPHLLLMLQSDPLGQHGSDLLFDYLNGLNVSFRFSLLMLRQIQTSVISTN